MCIGHLFQKPTGPSGLHLQRQCEVVFSLLVTCLEPFILVFALCWPHCPPIVLRISFSKCLCLLVSLSSVNNFITAQIHVSSYLTPRAAQMAFCWHQSICVTSLLTTSVNTGNQLVYSFSNTCHMVWRASFHASLFSVSIVSIPSLDLGRKNNYCWYLCLFGTCCNILKHLEKRNIKR